MRSQKSKIKKAAKARARFKDYKRRHNINRNVPTEKKTEEVEKYARVKETVKVFVKSLGRYKTVIRDAVDHEGKPSLRHVGYKTKAAKKKVYKHLDPTDPTRPMSDEGGREVGMIRYPK